jgi:hypothetical protein
MQTVYVVKGHSYPTDTNNYLRDSWVSRIYTSEDDAREFAGYMNKIMENCFYTVIGMPVRTEKYDEEI